MRKFTLKEITLGFLDFIFICIRPAIIYIIWNFFIASKEAHIPELSTLQVIGIVVIVNLFITYIPTLDVRKIQKVTPVNNNLNTDSSE